MRKINNLFHFLPFISGVALLLAGGTTSGSTDGIGSNALFRSPSNVAVSANGLVYVTDSGNNLVRVITKTGMPECAFMILIT